MTASTRRLGITAGALVIVSSVVLGGASIASSAPNQPPLNVVVGNDPAAPVPVAGAVTVGNLPATQQVAGEVSITNLPADQAVSGTVDIGNLPATQTVDGTVAISNLPATQAVTGKVTATSADEAISSRSSIAFAAKEYGQKEVSLDTRRLSEVRLNIRCNQPGSACAGTEGQVYSFSGDVPYLMDTFRMDDSGHRSVVYESPGQAVRVVMWGAGHEFPNSFRLEAVGRP